MANQLPMDKSFAINNLRDAGYSERRIAETLGISRGAVRRHLRREVANSTTAPTALGSEAPTGPLDSNGTKAPTGSEAAGAPSDQPTSASQCEAYREVIVSKLDQGLTAKRIHQDLVSDYDFGGRYWSVNRFVRQLVKSNPAAFRRMETDPGQEMQVDFGTGAKIRLSDGRHKKTHVFRCVLSHSRKGYSESVLRQDTESFIRCLENAFWAFGGAPERIVFDNAKCAVKTPDWYDPEINPKVLDFCKHYGCVFSPTRVRTPRHKGKVERGVDYVQENALRGHVFDSLADQNEHLANWEKTVADTRIHGTTCKQVKAAFETSEKPALRPLPIERFPLYHEAKRIVSRDGYISINRTFYSAPPEYLGRDVWARYDSRIVRILNSSFEVVATHAVADRGRFVTDSRHIVSEKVSPIERGLAYLHGKIRLIGPGAARWAEATVRHRGVEASRVLLGVLALSRKHDSKEIDEACSIAYQNGAYNSRTIRTLLKRQKKDVQTTMEFMEEHTIIRSMSDYANLFHEIIQKGICQ